MAVRKVADWVEDARENLNLVIGYQVVYRMIQQVSKAEVSKKLVSRETPAAANIDANSVWHVQRAPKLTATPQPRR